ncbi:hypothetical protein CP02DC21_1359, partial [Chlamydia psittaci 02DC21]
SLLILYFIANEVRKCNPSAYSSKTFTLLMFLCFFQYLNS